MNTPQLEKQIEKFIKYIRKMNGIIDDNQLALFIQLSYAKNYDGYTSIGVDIPGHIKFIRKIALMTDNQIRSKMRKQYKTDVQLQHVLETGAQRTALSEMTEAAKNYRSDPRSFARKVDRELATYN